MVKVPAKDVWNSVSTLCGVRSVMTSGAVPTPKWLVHNLATQEQVRDREEVFKPGSFHNLTSF